MNLSDYYFKAVCSECGELLWKKDARYCGAVHKIEDDLADGTRFSLDTFAFCADTIKEWIEKWGIEDAARMVKNCNWDGKDTIQMFATAWGE